MRVHSICSFDNHAGFKGLTKGESDFDVSKLSKSQRAFFDGLVDAGIVSLVPSVPVDDDAKQGASSVDGESEQKTKKK